MTNANWFHSFRWNVSHFVYFCSCEKCCGSLIESEHVQLYLLIRTINAFGFHSVGALLRDKLHKCSGHTCAANCNENEKQRTFSDFFQHIRICSQRFCCSYACADAIVSKFRRKSNRFCLSLFISLHKLSALPHAVFSTVHCPRAIHAQAPNVAANYSWALGSVETENRDCAMFGTSRMSVRALSNRGEWERKKTLACRSIFLFTTLRDILRLCEGEQREICKSDHYQTQGPPLPTLVNSSSTIVFRLFSLHAFSFVTSAFALCSSLIFFHFEQITISYCQVIRAE